MGAVIILFIKEPTKKKRDKIFFTIVIAKEC